MKTYSEIYKKTKEQLEDLQKQKEVEISKKEKLEQQIDETQNLRVKQAKKVEELGKKLAVILSRPKKHDMIERVVGVLLLALLIFGFVLFGTTVVNSWIAGMATPFAKVLASSFYFGASLLGIIFCGGIFMLVTDALDDKHKEKMLKTPEYQELDSQRVKEHEVLLKLHDKYKEEENQEYKSKDDINKIETKIREVESFINYLESLNNEDTKKEELNNSLTKKRKKNNNDEGNVE